MAQHILYGIRNAGVSETADAVGTRVGCTFQERESDYLGTYLLASVGIAEIKVVPQPDPAGDPIEDEFDDYETLVFVDADSDFPILDGVRVGSEILTRLRLE